MAQIRVLSVAALPRGEKKSVKAGETEILLIHQDSGLVAVQAKCPHAGAPLEKGAVCNGRLVCPWHMATFALPSGGLLEPPAMAPLETYAVSVEGDDILVDPAPLPQDAIPVQPSTAEQLVLLVGAGAAGAMAATTLRQGGFGGRIVAVDPVADEPVDRTQLTKQALNGKMPLQKLPLATQGSIDWERVQASVVSLSSAQSSAQLSNGESIRFTRALVATGGAPRRLSIPGADLAYTIRHVQDVRKILAAAEGKQTAAVIGTSFIALEAASALMQKGLQVTVVGREELPFAGKFGEQVGVALKSLHASKGTRFRLGVEEIVGITPDGVLVKAAEADELVPAELVLMGVGVEPELGFDHDLPLSAEGGGIATDASLRAAGQVWVAGDIANVDGTRIEHWRLAEQHGRVAALGMLGEQAQYEGVPFFWTFHFGKRLGYLGHAEKWDKIVIDGNLDALEFVAFYVAGGDVVAGDNADEVKAVLTCGRDSQTAMLAELMRSRPTLEQALSAIA